jgi:hypothetical protein
MSGHGHGEAVPADDLLVRRLGTAVTRAITDLASLPTDARRKQAVEWCRDGAQHIAERGDTLRFGGKPDEVKTAFTILARTLAALAHSPGGVTFMRRHWCVDHALCEQADRDATTAQVQP